MIDSIARSNWSKSLLVFADKNRLSDAWDDPQSTGVEAHVTGWKLDNMNEPAPIVGGQLNDEMLVILKSPTGECVINLNEALALAAAYIRDSYAKARSSISARPSPAP